MGFWHMPSRRADRRERQDPRPLRAPGKLQGLRPADATPALRHIELGLRVRCQRNFEPIHPAAGRSLPPSVHTVPTQFHARDGHFTRHQGAGAAWPGLSDGGAGQAGPPRTFGLSTVADKSRVHSSMDGSL